MKFSSIPGLTQTKSLLVEAVRHQHLAHAQLFAGAEGALNLPMALAYATFLHCENKGDDACGSCAACSKSLKYIHPDTHFVFPVGNLKDKDEERAKADILKAWRSFLLDQPFGDLDDWIQHYGGEDKQAAISREESREIIKTLALKPFESRYKVMIIWQPEMMHPAAANGILKILEEPPAHTYFILASNAKDKLLPTIVSRTQHIAVPLLTDSEIQQHISAQGIPADRAMRLARQAEGRLLVALQLAEKEEDQSADRFLEWMRACFNRDYARLVTMAEDFHGLDRLNQRNVMQFSLAMVRETLLAHVQAHELQRIEGAEQKSIQRFAQVLSIKKIEQSYRLLTDAAYHLERNGSAKMIFLNLSLTMSKLLQRT
jgi:DNA polymerase-3 subunit delta'